MYHQRIGTISVQERQAYGVGDHDQLSPFESIPSASLTSSSNSSPMPEGLLVTDRPRFVPFCKCPERSLAGDEFDFYAGSAHLLRNVISLLLYSPVPAENGQEDTDPSRKQIHSKIKRDGNGERDGTENKKMNSARDFVMNRVNKIKLIQLKKFQI